MVTTSLFLAAALAAQAPATETSAAPTPSAHENADTAHSNSKTICKRVAIRGSRFKERKCATADQWERQRRHNVQITREMQQSDGSSKAGT